MYELSSTEWAVCALISSVMFGRPLALPDTMNWDAVYKELTAHAILGLFRDAVPLLGLPPDIEKEWARSNYRILARGIRIAAGQAELVRLLGEEDIPYAILKGTAAAQYYPVEHSRSLGDVDFIVKELDYERAQQLLEAHGYIRAFEHEDNYRHESFNKNGIHYECHRSFADRSFAHAARIDEMVRSGIDDAIDVETEYGRFMCLPTAVNGLVLLEHIAIHIKAGIGLRQIIDWLLYAEENLGDDKWGDENGRVIRESGLVTLAKTVTRAGQLYFGACRDATWCADAPEDTCGELMRLVFSYGNFGSKNTIDDKVIGVARRYRRGIMKNLRESGEHNWKLLHKHPWLRFLAPAYQVGRYTRQILSRRGALRALLVSGRAVDEREHLMLELGI